MRNVTNQVWMHQCMNRENAQQQFHVPLMNAMTCVPCAENQMIYLAMMKRMSTGQSIGSAVNCVGTLFTMSACSSEGLLMALASNAIANQTPMKNNHL